MLSISDLHIYDVVETNDGEQVQIMGLRGVGSAYSRVYYLRSPFDSIGKSCHINFISRILPEEEWDSMWKFNLLS